jgi:hypothetical protein
VRSPRCAENPGTLSLRRPVVDTRGRWAQWGELTQGDVNEFRRQTRLLGRLVSVRRELSLLNSTDDQTS